MTEAKEQHVRVTNWAQFEHRVRATVPNLLTKLPDYPNSILVAGCQRSGTTAITRIIRDAIGMPDFKFTRDDELDAALILSGFRTSPHNGRHCFQTTYLNEHVGEYFEHDDFRLVWIVRQPQSVIQSMLFNWRRAALRRLFRQCGHAALEPRKQTLFARFGTLPFSRLEMACFSYNAKVQQTSLLVSNLSSERLLIVDYDDLLERKERILPRIFNFAGIEFDDHFLSHLRRSRKSRRVMLGKRSRGFIEQTCAPEYERVKQLSNPVDVAR